MSHVPRMFLFLLALFACKPVLAAEYSFGVINQRSTVLTAQYWNPILRYVSAKSGVTLKLLMARSGSEHSAMVGRGEFDFVYSNHLFTRENDAAGYHVIARPAENAIQGEIVVREDSAVHKLDDLRGKEVAFPSKQAFVAYYVTMDALLRAGIEVKAALAGNQEGAMAQLKAGRVEAASVNSSVMRDFAAREQLPYRVLWRSPKYLNIPIAAHPKIDAKTRDAVRAAFVGMAADHEGAAILEQGAKLIKQPPPYGFVATSNSEYENYRVFFRKTLVRDE